MDRVRAIDLFCGAGGSSQGAESAGVEILAGFDIWPPAARTYAANFPNARVFQNDIRSLSPKDLRREIGRVDLILASPECTNHSVAKGAKERDEESRLTAFEVVRFANEFRPQWIVMENVVQMQSWSEHDRLVDELEHLGYSVKPTSLNAQDFGVPQSRNRLFLLCSLSKGVNLYPPQADQFKPASSIIDTSGIYKFSMLRVPSRAKPTIARAERAIDVIGSDTPFLIVYYGSDGSGGWQPINKPLRTITTLDRFAYVEPADGGHVMRMLQPNELKLAMGFDADFKLDLPGFSRRQKIRLMGNGVCPPVMEFIIRAMTGTNSQHSEDA